jgi:hypothetical protein
LPYFSFKFFFQYLFQINEKKLYKMATLTFRLGDHIYFICSLKNHMTWFSDFWSKIIRNISKNFLISCSKILKLIFLESLNENMKNTTFYFIQICPRFLSSPWFILSTLIFAANHSLGEIGWSSRLSKINKFYVS